MKDRYESLNEWNKKVASEFINKCKLKIQNGLIGINDVIDDNGYSLLHYVAENGNVNTLEWLIKNGANIHLKIGSSYTLAGYTALYLAVQKNNIDLAKFLLEKTDISVDASLENGKTPFFIAIYNHNESLVNLLFKQGANVNTLVKKNNNDFTLLEFFLAGGSPNNLSDDNLKSAEMLLKLNATITKKAIEMVITSSDLKGLKLLHQYGACFTPDLLELATSFMDEKFKVLEKEKKDLYLKWETMSEREKYFAESDLNPLTNTFNKYKDIKTFIESALTKKVCDIS